MNIIKVTSFIFGCAFAFFVTQSAQGSDVPQFPAGDSNPPVTSAQTSGASGRAFPPLGPLPPAAIPAYNPQTRAKIDLGKKLYFDPRLSGNNWISCATCHNPSLGFADGLPRMLGGPTSKEGGRNSPTIINCAYNEFQFWDGRAATLEEQALGPIQNPNEMFETLDNVVRKLSGIPDYVTAFKEVFGTGVTADGIAMAIAAFERTIVFANSPFDRYMQGDVNAMSESAKRGMELFNAKAECIKCHNGPNFTDNKFHNIGVPADGPLKEDLGRYSVTKNDADKGAFKTPTLRNITESAPYMHNGFFPTLFEVVQFYNGGGGRSENKSPDIHALNLTGQEVNDLIEFMKALTGELVQITYDATPLVYPNLPKGF
ncbi:MAG: cytochrome-c peroxidase [Candidatus Brocadia sp. AMX2]|uniref:Cytochrome c peroxidase n=1 Tax=Candidatus Brocadia sinica JPN1 TaxID=1197129 RepID=A0ABQ0JXC3_9BACT|nr:MULTISPECIES: cytochrome c peroxidase [Brocadia]KXK29458.1 MAG: cytochrome c peroxidase [Candidatus Brocadia sinica]MBC6932050.1 cytochrome-c peroxidase [Candidatus Brocadia sp.]MBL1169503.1 cytochrome-c peroxidase [Candidatus Brocadia sp. AMX1]NOG40784.1 c-type cytochrome [Planctomycetota bacterium]MCE7866333.1 cytochrome-c peroxidase [Candidatus Brocadia sp. AMX2]